jgi:hypothetical protein
MSKRDHDDGQRDGSSNVYHPPYGLGEELFDFFTPGGGSRMEDGHERNSDYDKGWTNGRKQS